MIYALPPIDILPAHWDIVHAILQKHIPSHPVWAFGSRVTGKAKPFSDLDLVIISNQPLPWDVRASLCDDFSESDLPYHVDVVEWATTSPTFRQIIARHKVVVQTGVLP